jgi:hypothetical protein
MSKKAIWLIVRSALIALFVVVILLSPSKDTTQLFLRTVMLIVFSVTFLMDLYDYRNRKN